MSLQTNIPNISVGIVQRASITFLLDGEYLSDDVQGFVTGECTAILRQGEIVVTAGGAEVGRAPSILLSPRTASSIFTLRSVTIGVGFHWQQEEEQRFVGSLKLVQTGDHVVAVNVVSIEEYLASVISSEMSAGSSLSLLKAHAITSRSWLLAQLERLRRPHPEGAAHLSFFESETERIRWYDREEHELFDVCADDHCQRYQGITKACTPSVHAAVRDTAGVVLMQEGKICDARFSKSCGGITEEFHNTWEPVRHSYLSSVVDTETENSPFPMDFSVAENAERWIRNSPSAFCNTQNREILSQVLLQYDQETTDFYRWKVEYTQEELAGIIKRRSGLDFGQILDLLPVKRGPSSRLITLKIVGTKRALTIGKELEIRRTLSNSHLYSSAFVVEALDRKNGVPSRFVLYGAGWGHGVGLCQIGAAVMGQRGFSYEQILNHYFPGTTLVKIYERPE